MSVVRTTVRAKLVALGDVDAADLGSCVAIFVCSSVEHTRALGRWMYEEVEIDVRLADESRFTEPPTSAPPHALEPIDASTLGRAEREQLTAELLGVERPALLDAACSVPRSGSAGPILPPSSRLPSAPSRPPRPAYEPSLHDLNLSQAEATELGRLTEKPQPTPAGTALKKVHHKLAQKGLVIHRTTTDREGASILITVITERGIRIAQELSERPDP